MIFSRSAHSKSDKFFVVLKVSLKKKTKHAGCLWHTPNWVKRFRMRCVIANTYSEDLPNSFKSLGHRKSTFLFFFIFPENCIVLLRNRTHSGIPIPRTYRTALNLLVTGKVLFFPWRIASYCYVTVHRPSLLLHGLSYMVFLTRTLFAIHSIKKSLWGFKK